MHFYLDSRQHGSQSLIYPSLGQFQGPSLLSYNDAMFQEKDWRSIQDMQQSVKSNKGEFYNCIPCVYYVLWGDATAKGEGRRVQTADEKYHLATFRSLRQVNTQADAAYYIDV